MQSLAGCAIIGTGDDYSHEIPLITSADRAGINKYTAESLANADDEAIRRFVNTVDRLDGVTDSEGNDLGQTLWTTAYEALQKQQSGTLNIKPEVANELKKLTEGHIPAPKAGSNELYVRHEEDAMRMGKTTITVPPNLLTGTPASTFEGYAAPAGFHMDGETVPVLDTATGHYIYKDASDPNGRRAWDATIGRYVNLPPSGSGGSGGSGGTT